MPTLEQPVNSDDGEHAKGFFHDENGIPVLDVKRLTVIEREQAEAKERDEEYRDEQLELNRQQVRVNSRVALFTFLLVICTAGTGGVALYQAHVAKLNAEAAARNADAAKQQAEASRSMLEQMKLGAADTHALAEAAGIQAKAAIGALNLSMNSFRVAERPYISLENVGFDSPLEQSHDPAVIKWDWHNAGRTPALKATFTLDIFIDGKNTLTLPRTFASEMTIASDRSATSSVNIWIRGPGDLDGILSGTRSISLKGRIKYTDIFKQWHTTTFCNVYDSQNKKWVFCPGNDIE